MKKKIALLLMITLLTSLCPMNILAEDIVDNLKTNTVVWEGTTDIYSETYKGGAKVRFTIKGVIGKQLPNNKVEIPRISMQGYGGEQFILPIVEGGSIKAEFLEKEETMTPEDTDIQIANVYTGYITLGYGDKKEVKYDSENAHKIFVDKEYDEYINPEAPLKFTKVKKVNGDKERVAYISMPIGHLNDSTFAQVFTEKEAQKMIKDMTEESETVTIGKMADEPHFERYEHEYLDVSKEYLEQKYGFIITMEDGFFTKPQFLELLDDGLSYFPDGLIKEITTYYKKRGIPTYVRLQYKRLGSGNFVLYGAFTGGKANVIQYFPTLNEVGEAGIAHEMGHFVHRYLKDRYGYNKMREEWTALNGGNAYRSEIDDEEEEDLGEEYFRYFATGYGSKNFSEDVATMFEILAVNRSTGTRNEFIDNPDSPVRKKEKFLTKLLMETTNSVKNPYNVWRRSIPQSPNPSSKEICKIAETIKLVPATEEFRGLYISRITRKHTAELLVNLIKMETGKEMKEIALEKGVHKEWYNESYYDGRYVKVHSNYPYCDTSNKEFFELHALGIMQSETKWRFDADGYVKKEQLAQLLYDTAMLLKPTNPTDEQIASKELGDKDAIEQTYKQAVDFVVAHDIMDTTKEGLFNPHYHVTYERAYRYMVNLYQYLHRGE